MIEAAIPMADLTDTRTHEAGLLERALRGDLDAFEAIVMLHERKIFALALRIGGNVEDAQDVTQEAFIRLHRNLRHIESGRTLSPWLYSVTVNLCHDVARRRHRSRLVPIDDRNPADPAPDPERRASGLERERQLRAGLQTLPEKERAAIVLREMEGLSTDEVAQILGSSVTTVRSQISNARARLRQFLGKETR